MFFDLKNKIAFRIAPLSLGLALSFGFASAVGAQAPTPSPTPADVMPVAPTVKTTLRPIPDSARVGVDLSDQLSLTLEQAIELALKNNNDIDASRKDISISEFRIRGAKGVYDPLLNSQSFLLYLYQY